METKGEYGKLIIIASVLALLYASYKIIAPFKIALLTSVILAIALYPIYIKLTKKIKNKNFAALALIFSLIFLVLIPLIFFTNAMFQETINLYNTASGMDLSEQSLRLQEATNLNINFERYFKETILKLSQTFIASSSKITGYIFGGLLNIFIIFFSLFFFLRDGKKIVRKLRTIFPFKERIKKRFEIEVVNSVRGLFLGLLIIALIEGSLAFIGFYLFDIPTPLVWSFLVIILAMVPLLGPALIYVPASIYLLVMGQTTDAILLFIYSVIALGYTDNILRHQIMNKTSKINQVALLVGVFGGIQVMGIPGIIIGPLVLSLIMAVYRIYEEEYASKD
jgi:predicted PurR-regulated permease PerM